MGGDPYVVRGVVVQGCCVTIGVCEREGSAVFAPCVRTWRVWVVSTLAFGGVRLPFECALRLAWALVGLVRAAEPASAAASASCGRARDLAPSAVFAVATYALLPRAPPDQGGDVRALGLVHAYWRLVHDIAEARHHV